MPDAVLHRSLPQIPLTLRVSSRDPTASVLPSMGRLLIRGDADALRACGIEIPAVTRASTTRGSSVLWLGPDEWLMILPEDAVSATVGNMTAALAGVAHSLVDISHRQIAIEVSGSRAAALLNACVLLDLNETAFPIGCCTRTVFGKAEIVLWRRETQRFHIEVWRSFAEYVAGLLVEASHGIPEG